MKMNGLHMPPRREQTFRPFYDAFMLDLVSRAAVWYDFYEGSGTNLDDRSTNGNDATLAGPTWQPGKNGAKIKFDGVDDVISSNVVLVGGAYTFIFIFDGLLTDIDSNRTIFSVISETSQDGAFIIPATGVLAMFQLGVNNLRYWNTIAAYLDGSQHVWVVTLIGFGKDDILDAELRIDDNVIEKNFELHSGLPTAWDHLYIGKSGWDEMKSSMSFFAAIPGVLSTSEKSLLYHHLMEV